MTQHTSASRQAWPLELFVLQHKGQLVDYSWQWPGTAEQVGFDAILAGVPDLDATVLRDAYQCSLQRVGPVEQPVWLLANGSHTLVCSVNQRLLAAGSQLRLDHGDEIELGLTRCVVSLEPSQTVLDVTEQLPQPASPEDVLPGFKLTDLDAVAAPDYAAAPMDSGQMGQRSDFADLISMAPQELGPPPAAEVQPAPEDAPAQASAAPPEPTPDSDPLQALHARYLTRLRYPERDDAQDLWQDLVRGEQSKQADPMQQWMQAAGTAQGLDDLLGQSQHIASVMDGLDALGESDVLAPEHFDSVMHLFAPADLRQPAPEAQQTQMQHKLPGLTRREHHNLSVDSAMPFTGGEEPITTKKP